ncbi:muramoyltetrapeptide carboxypeptidase [Massilia yuzhufengensis]|uniref:Muramoyltetrapeptide carboxypeptidase n=1 Tax=Massilia yuzhufengensis TaxID=1164594 RepID=A0A1I1R5F4_9BURK|nr:muramoyltetrapeptide carboxypeptidase [Massilia yuzhufengensis]SFD26783.1 muramoyltetrapeptide carboxypeptidase [Massilia yuzhufengensis]
MITPQIGIAIVAPAGQALDPCAVDRAVARLEAHGCLVRNYYDHAGIHQRFGGTDTGRLQQLNAAVADPDVQLIMAIRGGYGTTRLLPHIDFEAIAASGKLVVGFSDITAIHMGLMARTGALSYAGPMAAVDFGLPEPVQFTLDDFWQCLAGPTHTIMEYATGNPSIAEEGRVWGGNLAMLTSLLGTPYFPHIEGGILYVEDVGEHPYKVERMLLQLQQAGVLGRQRALLLGDFSGYKLAPNDNGYDFEHMLAHLRATLPIPVINGLGFGHIPRRVTIPFGAQGRLVSQADGFSLVLSDYPTLRTREA